MSSSRIASRMSIVFSFRREEMLSFLRQWYVVGGGWIVLVHHFFIMLFSGLFVLTGLGERATIGDWLGTMGWAVIVSIVLFPAHEAIHAAGYFLSGANDVRFRYSFRSRYACVMAHHHVLDVRWFTWLTVAPFLLITGVIAMALAALPEMSFLILGVLVLHTIICISDWAQLSVLWKKRDIPLYVFHDAEDVTTYFVSVKDAGLSEEQQRRTVQLPKEKFPV